MLIARTYSAVDEVEIDGVKFQIAPVPDGVWRGLMLKKLDASRRALRRNLAALKAEGTPSPTEEEVQEAALRDPVWHADLEAAQMEIATWGVRGHSGLRFEDGQPVPFESKEREYLGRKFAGASEETAALYQDIPDLLARLYEAIEGKNGLTAQKKRASQPSSPPVVAPDSPATTAPKLPTSPT